MSYTKILSLDGGGAWSIIQAYALKELFPDLGGRDILKKFDLVAANSGGSLVAGCLAVDMAPQQIISMFKNSDARESIFYENFIRILTKYDTEKKLIGIRGLLNNFAKNGLVNGDSKLNKMDGLPDFIIVAFDYDRQRSVFFRSNVDSLSSGDFGNGVPTLAEALHASSTAPVKFFDKPAQLDTDAFKGRKFWDGAAAGYNNPILVSVVEAISNNVDVNSIKILSLGTGSVFLPIHSEDDAVEEPLGVEPELKSDGYFDYVRTMACTILDDPPDAATYAAYRILHGAALCGADELRLIRMNPLIQPIYKNDAWFPMNVKSKSGLDDLEIFNKLRYMELDAVKQDEVDLIEDFCLAWICGDVLNQPIQSRNQLNKFECKIGHRSFKDSLDRARILFCDT